MLCGDGDDHSGRQVRFVDLHLYAHEIIISITKIGVLLSLRLLSVSLCLV